MTTTAPPSARPSLTLRQLTAAGGGPRYAAALAVDALGTGLLRPFLLLYGITVLGLSATTAGLAMTVGIVAGLACLPPLGRWLDRGARSTAVAASMLVRVAGVVVLLAAPAGAGTGPFTLAALLLGVGNQSWPAAHAALVATVSEGRLRDAALAGARSVRNAGLGVGALLAAGAMAAGPGGLRVLAVASGVGYLAAAGLAWSVRVAADPTVRQDAPGAGPAPRLGALLGANVLYVFCLNVPEIAVPLVLVEQLHASPTWAAAVFVANTVLVVTLQVPVTTWSARWSRGTVMAASGVVLALGYLGFLFATGLGPAAVALVSVPFTLGEILYAGSSTALVTALAPPALLGRALARFQLSTGFGLAVSPAAITALAAHGPAALWGTLAAGTAGASAAVWRERGRA
ncbi:MFS transporter [Kitasatospora sp. NPDC001664]